MLYVKLPFLKGPRSVLQRYAMFLEKQRYADKKVEHNFSLSKIFLARKVRRVIRFIAKRNG